MRTGIFLNLVEAKEYFWDDYLSMGIQLLKQSRIDLRSYCWIEVLGLTFAEKAALYWELSTNLAEV